tara:strand:+ start:1726 stop:1944 length:219 start_codon:yes stop_codon:yes gene_type:complete
MIGDNQHIDSLGTIRWYDNDGHVHREDGPAIIWPDGDMYWCLHDNHYNSFNKWLKLSPISDEQKLLLRLQYG